jgi:TRAP transporter TAXI family solute receptor
MVEDANTGSGKTRMRRVALVFFAVAALAIVGGTWWWETREREAEVLTVATGPLGSDAHTLMTEAADVVARHSKTLRLQVRVSRDSSSNIALLNNGRIDAAVIRSDTPVVSDVRVIADLYPDIMQVITRDDSNIFQITDLSRHVISIPEYGTDSFRSFWVLGDHYDLPIDRMRWTAERFEQGAGRLLAGEVDAFFTIRSLRDTQLIRMFEDAQLTGLKLRIIPVKQAEAIAVKRPFLEATSIPAGAYTGATPVPSNDIPTSSVERILVSRADVSEEMVRELTRILFEHRLDLTIRFSLASAIRKPDESRGLSVPLHDGAAAYYNRDEPSFIQENAEPLALMVTVFTLLLSAVFTLRSRFSSKQKNRADTYNYQLLAIQKKAILEDDPGELAGLKIELNDVLQTVVYALDTDDVTDEGFQSFSLLWEAVRETINDRLSHVQSGDAKT